MTRERERGRERKREEKKREGEKDRVMDERGTEKREDYVFTRFCSIRCDFPSFFE